MREAWRWTELRTTLWKSSRLWWAPTLRPLTIFRNLHILSWKHQEMAALYSYPQLLVLLPCLSSLPMQHPKARKTILNFQDTSLIYITCQFCAVIFNWNYYYFGLQFSAGAINQLTKNFACEWAKDGIRTNTVAPWGVRTQVIPPVCYILSFSISHLITIFFP